MSQSGRLVDRSVSATFRPDNLHPSEELTQLLEKAGIELPKNSRFRRFMALALSKKTSLDLRQLAYTELNQIIQTLRVLPNISEWKSKLQEALLYDMEIPGKHGATTRGRDTQFELLVAGRLAEIGATVTCDEPDVVCEYHGRRFGVAAKRLKSIQQATKRAADARAQIERTGISGIVALDFTPIFQYHHRRSVAIDPSAFVNFGSWVLDFFFEKNLESLQRAVQSNYTLGLIAFLEIGAFIPETSQYFHLSVHNGHCTRLNDPIDAEFMWQVVNDLNQPPR